MVQDNVPTPKIKITNKNDLKNKSICLIWRSRKNIRGFE